MECVECLNGEVEPSAMKSVNPVVGKTEHAKPDQKYRIVKGQTVKQYLFEGIGVHGVISHKGYLPCSKRSELLDQIPKLKKFGNLIDSLTKHDKQNQSGNYA